MGALYAAAQDFAESEPATFELETDSETGEKVLRPKVLRQPEPRIAMIAGDCIHTLRQSLDYLAYRLAVFVGGDPPRNEASSGFPLYCSDKAFIGSLPRKIGPPKKIPAPMQAALESFQPGKGGDGELLGLLVKLDDRDKHRFPPLVTALVEVPVFNINSAEVTSLVGPRIGPLEHDTEIIRYAPKPGAQVDMDFQFSFGVAFASGSPGGGMPVVGTLDGIRRVILHKVFPALERWA